MGGFLKAAPKNTTLADLGITKDESAKAQFVAEIKEKSPDRFDAYKRGEPQPVINGKLFAKGDHMSDSDAATHDLMVALLQLQEEAKSSHSASLQYDLVGILLRKRLTMPNHISTWIKKQDLPKTRRSDVHKIAEPKVSRTIQHALDLYDMMARLIPFCEPDGPGEGPSCRVRLLQLERMSVMDLLSTTSHLRFLWKLEKGKFAARAIDLLEPDERKLYLRARECGLKHNKKPKLTLQSLAARVLEADGASVFSDGPRRFVKALNQSDYAAAPAADWSSGGHRGRMIRMVNHFGSGDRAPIGPAITAQMKQIASETLARFTAETQIVTKGLAGLVAAIGADPEFAKTTASALVAIRNAALRDVTPSFMSLVKSEADEQNDPTIIKGPRAIM